MKDILLLLLPIILLVSVLRIFGLSEEGVGVVLTILAIGYYIYAVKKKHEK